MPKGRWSVVTKNAKKSGFAVTEKCQKLASLQSRKNAKNPHVCGQGKYQKLADPLSRKNAKNLAGPRVGIFAIMPRTRKFADTKDAIKLAGPRSRKMPKTRRSAVTENAKNSQVRSH